jgi:hypothetical protein
MQSKKKYAKFDDWQKSNQNNLNKFGKKIIFLTTFQVQIPGKNLSGNFVK